MYYMQFVHRKVKPKRNPQVPYVYPETNNLVFQTNVVILEESFYEFFRKQLEIHNIQCKVSQETYLSYVESKELNYQQRLDAILDKYYFYRFEKGMYQLVFHALKIIYVNWLKQKNIVSNLVVFMSLDERKKDVFQRCIGDFTENVLKHCHSNFQIVTKLQECLVRKQTHFFWDLLDSLYGNVTGWPTFETMEKELASLMEHIRKTLYKDQRLRVVIRGHIRESLQKPDLYSLCFFLREFFQAKFYIHSWNIVQTDISWRKLEKKNELVNKEKILSYFQNIDIEHIILEDESMIQLYRISK